MQIEWVNHASFVLEAGPVRLLVDPWIEGYVFDRSWALLSPTTFDYRDFDTVTHIWFSHEHPDHFNPSNLRLVPAEIRKRITVLFQPTRDKRVVKYCRNLGFPTVEAERDWQAVGDDVRALCQPIDRGDSWLAVRSRGQTILDLNDCVYLSERELEPVKRQVEDVDVLITQFSYASWWGNRTDDRAWSRAAAETLEKIEREINVLRPRFVLLAASFVYFCHEENAYMNAHLNTVETAHRLVESGGQSCPIVLYPGDRWTVGHPHDSRESLARYASDYDRAMSDPVRVIAAKVAVEVLIDAADRFIQSLRRANSPILWSRIPPALVWVTDGGASFELSRRGLKAVDGNYDTSDIALSSSALLYCFQFPWGGETLRINGRFEAPTNGDAGRFFRWTSIAAANGRGERHDLRYYTRRALAKIATMTSR